MHVTLVKDWTITHKANAWPFSHLKAVSFWRIFISDIPWESIKSINIFGLKQVTDTSKPLEKAKIYYANWMYLAWALCNFYINKWLECSLQRPMWLVQKLHKFTYCLMKYMSFCLQSSQVICKLPINSKGFNGAFCSRTSYNTCML